MWKSRNIQITGVALLIIAATLISVFATQSSAAASVDLSWPPRPDFSSLNQKASIPITGNQAASDFYQRHPELRGRASATLDTSDYALRHRGLLQPLSKIGPWDMFLFHPYARKAR